MSSENSSISAVIQARVDQAPKLVWTPDDFVDIGGRDAVDKALHWMAKSGRLRRIDRGQYNVIAGVKPGLFAGIISSSSYAT